MLKKIFLVFVLFFSFFSLSFAADDSSSQDPSSVDFMINVWDLTPGWKAISSEAWEWADSSKIWTTLLQSFINKLMIAFWVLSLLIMTIWAWYMIIYHGQDELLSKWKTIFTSWLIALIVALSAWILVKMLAYFLY